MNVQKYACDGAEVFVIDRENLNLILAKRRYDLLPTRIIAFPEGSQENYQPCDLAGKDRESVAWAVHCLVENAFKIAERLNFGLEKPGATPEQQIEFLRQYKGKIQRVKNQVLDLSNLALTSVPFIELIQGLAFLYLAGNQFVVLPPHFQALATLPNIDVRGNYRPLDLEPLKKRTRVDSDSFGNPDEYAQRLPEEEL